MATPQHKNRCPGGHEIYNFIRPFLGHFYFIVSLSDLCLGAEKKIFKEIIHFYYMTYMATPYRPQHKNPCPGSHESCNFDRPFLGHHYLYILSLSDLCLGVKKKILKGIMHFHYKIYMFTSQHKNPCLVVMEFTILVDPSLVIITIHTGGFRGGRGGHTPPLKFSKIKVLGDIYTCT